MRAIRVVDHTQRHPKHESIVLGALPGVSHALCVLAVASDDSGELGVALLPSWHSTAPESRELPESARELLGDHIIAFSASAGDGEVIVSVANPLSDEHSRYVAAVAAVVQRSYGWDESQIIAVEVRGQPFRFDVRLEDDGTFLAAERDAA